MTAPPPIRLPAGVRDFLPRAAGRRRAIAEALLGEFERWGYDRIITPAFEYADVLARGLGEDAKAAAIRFVEPATGDVVALRPDITPQVARIAATRLGDAPGPVRLCYEGAVLRLMPGARGQREIIQAGVELIDAPAPQGDGEVLALAGAALVAAGFPEVTLDVGHVALMRSLLASVDDPVLRAELKGHILRKDQGAVARAAGKAELPPRRRKLLEELPALYGEAKAVIARARALALAGPERAALAELEQALALAAAQGLPARVTCDLGEVRGFDYYTGIRFAAYVPGAGDAALRGGRYDNLVGRYGRAARATGFAVDVETVAQAHKAMGRAPVTAPGVLVVDAGGGRERAFRVAAALRAAGVRAPIDLVARKGNGLVSYAQAAGLGAVLVLDKRKARALEGGAERVLGAQLVDRAMRGEGAALAAALGLNGKRRS